MKRNALTDSQIKAVKATDGKTQLTDGMGLYLKLMFDRVRGHQWRFDYTRPTTKKRNTMPLGDYPMMGLKQAREAADKLRQLVAQGIDPCAARDEAKAEIEANVRALAVADERKAKGLAPEGSLLGVAEDYHGAKLAKGEWKLQGATEWLQMLKRCLPLTLAHAPIASIRPVQILREVIEPLEIAGKDATSRAVRKYLTQVFDYAEVLELRQGNPARVIRSQCKQVIQAGNNPGVVRKDELRNVLTKIAEWPNVITRCALQVQAALFQRPSDTCNMRWADIDLDGAMWTIQPEARTKIAKSLGGAAHRIPLPRQVVEVLRQLQPITGRSEWVFLSTQGTKAPITNDTLTNALRKMGLGDTQTAHGFRATARTMIVEVLGFEAQYVECQLAHTGGLQKADGSFVKDSLGTAYNRATFLEQRVGMLQAWADFLDSLAAPAPVIPLPVVAPLQLAA